MKPEQLREFKKYEHAEKVDKLLYRPSSSEQWLNCGASSYLSQDIVEEKKPYAEEGTMAHAVAEALYYQENFGIPVDKDKFAKEYPNFIDKWDEMIIHAHGYLNVIKDIKVGMAKGMIPVGNIIYEGVEKDILIGEGTYGLCRGTADYIIIGDKGALILDFKYGKGMQVSANTTQIKSYFCGLLGIMGNSDFRFISAVHQPRITDAYTMHTYSHTDIMDHYTVISKILNTDPATVKATPGSHCFWCKASRTKDMSKRCKAKDEKERDNLFDAMSGLIPNVQKKSRTEMVKDFLSAFPAMLKLYNQLQAEFASRVEGGEKIQGMRVETKLGRRGWIKRPKAEMKQLFASAYPGVDLFQMVEKQRTITEIERQLKAKLSPEFVQATQSTQLVVDGEADLDINAMFENFTKKD